MASEQTQLTRIKEKRIMKEIKDIQQNPVDEENNIYESSPGCYVHINDEDITNHKIMIIGPDDTPYESGFYMFDYTYNKNHPFEAPYVKYLTTDGNVRFNPNLYSNGKVCLSILGTWSGPAWEPTMSLRVVCEYLRSILNERPIQNEPGFENSVGTECQRYNLYVNSENYGFAILKNLTELKLTQFSRIINLKFIENFSKIKNKLISLNTPSNNKYLGTKISPYSKEFRYSFNQTNLNIIFQFLNLYHNSKTNKFKITQLFDTDLIEKIYQTDEIKIYILESFLNLTIETIDIIKHVDGDVNVHLINIYQNIINLEKINLKYFEKKIKDKFKQYNPTYNTKLWNDSLKKYKTEPLQKSLEIILSILIGDTISTYTISYDGNKKIKTNTAILIDIPSLI
jgi:ubiquitin-protein ligase